MSDILITREEFDGRKGRYVAHIDGIDAEGEITITRRGPNVISADHTGVPDAMAGKGVAKALLEFMLQDARDNDFRIVPLCPYVFGQYAKHPEWEPLFTSKPGEKPRLGA